VPGNAAKLKIFDLGDLIMSPTLEETHQQHEDIVYQILNDGKTVIVLGGGNDISYPDCSALSRITNRSLTAFNIDSHFDVRDSYPRNSGTPYRQLLEGDYLHPPHFYEIACKEITNSPVYRKYLEEKGVSIYTLDQVRQTGIKPLFEKILDTSTTEAIFWGFDIDVVRANDAPGVSASYPVGLTAEEICQIAALAGQDGRSRVFEITEVNPKYDIDGRTAKLAAMMIIYFIGQYSMLNRS
jgi:formiminoglutamase